MSVWALPAILVWLALLLVAAIGSASALRPAIHEVCEAAREWVVETCRWINRTFHDPSAVPRRSSTAWRLLAALGGYFLALFVIGLVASLLDLGVVGTMLVMLFPGALIASRIYMAIRR